MREGDVVNEKEGDSGGDEKGDGVREDAGLTPEPDSICCINSSG